MEFIFLKGNQSVYIPKMSLSEIIEMAYQRPTPDKNACLVCFSLSMTRVISLHALFKKKGLRKEITIQNFHFSLVENEDKK